MRVTVGTTILADHDLTTRYEGWQGKAVKTSSVSNFRINGSRLVQEAQFVRATSITAFDRGNRKTVLTFDVSRLHESIWASEIFVLEHATKVPNSGLVVITARDFSSGSAGAGVVRYLEAAVIQVVDASYQGATSWHSYQIIGGQMLTRRSTS